MHYLQLFIASLLTLLMVKCNIYPDRQASVGFFNSFAIPPGTRSNTASAIDHQQQNILINNNIACVTTNRICVAIDSAMH